jgi:hypothetical protein
MNCSQCNTPLASDAKFCSNCAAPVNGSAAAAGQKQQNPLRRFIILGIVSFIFVVFIACWFIGYFHVPGQSNINQVQIDRLITASKHDCTGGFDQNCNYDIQQLRAYGEEDAARRAEALKGVSSYLSAH